MWWLWSFHLRAVLTRTPKSLKEETCSIVTPLYSSGSHDSLNLAGAITISLVFFQLIFIKFNSDHLLTELRWFCILDCSLLRIISERVVSLTNLCVRQVGSRSFIRDTKQSGHSQEPWGIAPLRVSYSVNNVEILVLWWRLLIRLYPNFTLPITRFVLPEFYPLPEFFILIEDILQKNEMYSYYINHCLYCL